MFGKRTKTTTGARKSGALLMTTGVILAATAGMLVLNTGKRAQAASDTRQAAREQLVVVATREIPELATIRAGDVALKPFPVGYTPAGAAIKIEDVVGKVATTRIVPDQLVLQPQVATVSAAKTPSVAIPADRVVFWMPLPDLLAQSNALRPGDKVDILLSVGISPASGGSSSQVKSLTTQTTLQAVEVYAIGTTYSALPADDKNKAGQQTQSSQAQVKTVAFVLNPQDAVLAKFIKDSNGTIDLVLRSREAQDVAPTEAVTADTLVDRFQFRIPQRWTTAK
ncbi:MAG TPA: Flp pilus assembly protein CpaB [Chloroflexota bacterium]|nr:Flp pilus assembly protein CpaB [Chloroflexota bacterium]